MKIGIVGLPNVGVVEVPDERLARLAEVSKSGRVVPAVVEFVDIAGLVKGASLGEGLGNQFLAHIREVDAIVQVVRAFKDANIIHVSGSVSPDDDKEIVNLELALADLQIIDKALERVKKDAKGAVPRELTQKIDVFGKVREALSQGKNARRLELTSDEETVMRDLHLLTFKPMLYVLNVDESDVGTRADVVARADDTIIICAKIEAELAALPPEEACQYLKELGWEDSGLQKLIKAGYKLLELITFFTSGEKETRAWTVQRSAKAPQAAGVIHSDFEKGFIRAEVIDWRDFVEFGGELGAKQKGKMRIEGKEYEVRDGDVCYFRVGT